MKNLKLINKLHKNQYFITSKSSSFQSSKYLFIPNNNIFLQKGYNVPFKYLYTTKKGEEMGSDEESIKKLKKTNNLSDGEVLSSSDFDSDFTEDENQNEKAGGQQNSEDEIMTSDIDTFSSDQDSNASDGENTVSNDEEFISGSEDASEYDSNVSDFDISDPENAREDDLVFRRNEIDVDRIPHINTTALRRKYELADEELDIDQLHSAEILDTPLDQLIKRNPQDISELVKSFKSKNLQKEEQEMKKNRRVSKYFDQDSMEDESDESFMQRYQKFNETDVSEIFNPGVFEINKELARPVFIGTYKEDFTRENLLESFKNALPLFRNNPEHLSQAFLSLIYFTTAETAQDWEESDYIQFITEVLETAEPNESEKQKLVSEMEESKKHFFFSSNFFFHPFLLF